MTPARSSRSVSRRPSNAHHVLEVVESLRVGRVIVAISTSRTFVSALNVNVTVWFRLLQSVSLFPFFMASSGVRIPCESSSVSLPTGFWAQQVLHVFFIALNDSSHDAGPTSLCCRFKTNARVGGRRHKCQPRSSLCGNPKTPTSRVSGVVGVALPAELESGTCFPEAVPTPEKSTNHGVRQARHVFAWTGPTMQYS